MINIKPGTSTTDVAGQKFNISGRTVVGALVVLYKQTTSSIVDKTTTDKDGKWSFTVSNVSIQGDYEVRFYGSGMRESLAPTGDWETFQISESLVSTAKSISVGASSLVVLQRKDGTIIPSLGTGITLSTTVQNAVSPAYKWYRNGSLIGGAVNSNFVVSGLNYPTTIDTYKVELYDPSLTSDDSVTITKLIDGSDTINVILSNETHDVTCDSGGNATAGELGINGRAITKVFAFYGISGLTPTTFAPSNMQFSISGLIASSGLTANTLGSDNVYINTLSASVNSGYVDIPVTTNVGGILNTITKRFSISKSLAGLQGTSSALGIVYRGLWNNSTTYNGSDVIRDVVKYNNYYYYCISGHVNHQPDISPTYWAGFTNSFASVATDILLAQDANITRTLILGDEVVSGIHNLGIMRSSTASSATSGNGFYLANTVDGTGQLRIGTVVSGLVTSGLYWDGPNSSFSINARYFSLTPSGTLWANNGGFGGTSISPKVLIDSNGLYVKDSSGNTTTYVTGLEAWRNNGPENMSSSAELISNPGFESVNTAWTRGGSSGAVANVSLATPYSRSGSYAMFITGDDTITPTAGYAYQDITIDSNKIGKVFNISFWRHHGYQDELDGNGYYYPDALTFTLSYNSVVQQTITFTQYTLTDYINYSTQFTPTTSGIMRIRFDNARTSSDAGVFIDDVSVKYFTPFSELNSYGLFIENSPDSYIRFGQGLAEIKTQTLDVNNLNVHGTITTYGDQIFVGDTVVTGPIQVVNYSSPIPSGYAGLEIDNSLGSNPVLVWNNNKWRAGVRTSADTGSIIGTLSLNDMVLSSNTPTSSGMVFISNSGVAGFWSNDIGKPAVTTGVRGPLRIDNWLYLNETAYGADVIFSSGVSCLAFSQPPVNIGKRIISLPNSYFSGGFQINPGQSRFPGDGAVLIQDGTNLTPLQVDSHYGYDSPHALLNVTRYGPSSHSNGDDVYAIRTIYAPTVTNSATSSHYGAIYGSTNYHGTFMPSEIMGIFADAQTDATGSGIAPAYYGVKSRIRIMGGNSTVTLGTNYYAQAATATGGHFEKVYSAYLEDQTVGTIENAAIRFGTEGKLSWNNDTFLKRSTTGTLELTGNFSSVGNITTTGTITLPNANVLTGLTNYVNLSKGLLAPVTTSGNAYGLFTGTTYNLISIQSATNNNADSAVTQNAYALFKIDSSSPYYWNGSHGSFGSRGIIFSFSGGIKFFADNVATTANTQFTPNTRLIIGNDGNILVNLSANASSDKLQVAGNQYLDSTLTLAGSTRNITTSTGGLTINPLDDLTISPSGNKRILVTPGVRIQSDNYVSQVTGWGITHSGLGDFRTLYADELHAKSFIADLEQSLAGGQIISKSVAPIFGLFLVPAPAGSGLLTVESFKGFDSFRVFASGDTIRLRQFSRVGSGLSIADAYGSVTFSSLDLTNHTQTYWFNRYSGANAGTLGSGIILGSGTLALDYGTAGNGFIESNAIDGNMGDNSPYTQIVTWSGVSPISANLSVRNRTGNLKGIFNIANEFGLYAGTGATVSDKYIRISNNTVELHNLPFKLYSGSNATIYLNPDAPSFAVGSGIAPSDHYVNGNKGVWMGNSSVLNQFSTRIGETSTSGLIDGLEYIPNSGFNLIGRAFTLTANSTDMVISSLSKSISLNNGNISLLGASGIITVGNTVNKQILIQGTPTQGVIRSGKTSYSDTTTGFWLSNSGITQFNLGNDTQYLTWNGTNLTIVGALVVSGLGSEFSVGTAPNWFRVDTQGNIWSGSTTLSGAQTNTFAVTNTGNLYARMGVISDFIIGTAPYGPSPAIYKSITGTGGGENSFISIAGNSTSGGFFVTRAGTLERTAGIVTTSTYKKTDIVFFAGGVAEYLPDINSTQAMWYVTSEGNVTSKGNSYIYGTSYVGSGIIMDGTGVGIITGGTLQTASSGQRIVIQGADNTLRFHSSTNSDVIKITGSVTVPFGSSIPGMEITQGALTVKSSSSLTSFSTGLINAMYSNEAFQNASSNWTGFNISAVGGSGSLLRSTSSSVRGLNISLSNQPTGISTQAAEMYGIYVDVTARADVAYGSRVKYTATGASDITNQYGSYSEIIGVSGHTTYGLYAKATGGTTNWAGYFDNGDVYINNNLYITANSSINYNSTHKSLHYVMPYGPAAVSTLLYSNTSTLVLATGGGGDESIVDMYTVLANSLTAGKIIRLKVWGELFNDNILTLSPTIKFMWGGSSGVVLSSWSKSIAPGATTQFYYEVTCKAHSTTSIVATSHLIYDDAAYNQAYVNAVVTSTLNKTLTLAYNDGTGSVSITVTNVTLEMLD